MPDVTLTYFDFPGGRGEDCRIALHIAGVPFHDDRVRSADWPSRKPSTPFGSLPVLKVDGREIAQSNAILAYIGRTWGLHPADPWEAARHEAMLAHAEDLRSLVDPTMHIADPEEKRKAREALAAGPLQKWAADAERQVVGPFVGGTALQVADLKLFVVMKWIAGGKLDHIPADTFQAYPRLSAHFQAMQAHPGVVSWYERGK